MRRTARVQQQVRVRCLCDGRVVGSRNVRVFEIRTPAAAEIEAKFTVRTGPHTGKVFVVRPGAVRGAAAAHMRPRSY